MPRASDPRMSFDSAAEIYSGIRPSYPAAMFNDLFHLRRRVRSLSKSARELAKQHVHDMEAFIEERFNGHVTLPLVVTLTTAKLA